MRTFPTLFDYITGTFPSVTATAASSATAKDGTAWTKRMIDDLIFGPLQAEFNLAGATPNGVAESYSESQILTVRRKIYANQTYYEARCTALGLTYDASDIYLPEKIAEAERGQIGDIEMSLIGPDPVAFDDARSTTNPSNAKYNPRIPIYDANHDISTTQVSALDVAAFRAKVFKIGDGDGTYQFSCTLASGVLTMPTTSAGYAMVAAMQEMGMVNRWYESGEAAGYGSLGALFSGYRAYCARINGTDYQISNVSTAGNTITISSPPSDGTYDVEFPCFAIAGSATSFRLRKVSGQAPVAANDYTGEVMAGGARMDRFENHWHMYYTGVFSAALTSGAAGIQTNAQTSSYTSRVQDTLSNGTNTLRTGKTTDPRTFGMLPFVKVAGLLATNWTSN